MNLMIIEKHEIDGQNLIVLSGKRFKHLKNILRCEVGSFVEVGLLGGEVGKAQVLELTSKNITLKCSFLKTFLSLESELDIICALPRPQTLKTLLQISAAMNVRDIYIISSNRVEPCYFNASVMEPEKMRKHLIKGLSQGKNTRLPKVHVYKQFKNFISKTMPTFCDQDGCQTSKFLFDPYAENMIESKQLGDRKHIVIAIGPEGGWVPFECDFMKEHGFDSCRLGPWPLRVEHAVVSAVSQIELAKSSIVSS